MNYLTTLLADNHQKENFHCGKEMLDVYFHRQAGQDMRKKVSTCFVLSDAENIIKGYYTLSSGSIPRAKLPDAVSKKLPRYEDIPVVLLGRLAVDLRFKGQGLGSLLLLDALQRSFDTASNAVGAVAVVVDPLDEDAKLFYKEYGFMVLPDSGRMFMAMKTIGELFKEHEYGKRAEPEE
jgi:GNAT superfamily N-acetyltransferase